eukprot:TRINITY_DN1044_c0_g1_i2.p7 TRINITY_DN1044_c0_g1~~TRINITY_DN1044_c0_g1_i2.p7  ORF type:complete len:356 (-),score=89.76 TRINITY_DN1044_c0_g1_i2:11477-12544(-)
MNEKLQKELKILTANLDKSLEKSKLKQKFPVSSNDANLNPREKELENMQRKIKAYQKEIAALKEKLEAKTGYEKIIDLENKLREGERKNQELQKQAQALEQILKNQEKELEKIKGNSETSGKLKALNEKLKTCKERNKELEKKLQSESASYQKQHTTLLDLQEKVQKLKYEKLRWKKAVADKLPAPPDEGANEAKRSEEEILQASLASLQKRLKIEKQTAAKTLEAAKAEVTEYQRKVKEAEQEQKLNTAKLAELKKVTRHNQLKPLEEGEEANPESSLAEGGSLHKTVDSRPAEVESEENKEPEVDDVKEVHQQEEKLADEAVVKEVGSEKTEKVEDQPVPEVKVEQLAFSLSQ